MTKGDSTRTVAISHNVAITFNGTEFVPMVVGSVNYTLDLATGKSSSPSPLTPALPAPLCDAIAGDRGRNEKRRDRHEDVGPDRDGRRPARDVTALAETTSHENPVARTS